MDSSQQTLDCLIKLLQTELKCIEVVRSAHFEKENFKPKSMFPYLQRRNISLTNESVKHFPTQQDPFVSLSGNLRHLKCCICKDYYHSVKCF